jgi:hypothetical protein
MSSQSARRITVPRTVFAVSNQAPFGHSLSIGPHRWLDIGLMPTAGAAVDHQARAGTPALVSRQRRPNAQSFGNRTRRLHALLAGGAVIAFTAFVAALPPQHQGPQQLRDASGVKLTSEQATIRAASGAGMIPAAAGIVAAVRVSDVIAGQRASSPINGDADVAALVSQRSGIGTLAKRLEGRGGGQVVDVDDDDTNDQDDDVWAQQQEDEAQQQEEEQEQEEQQEQDEQNEEQAQQSLQPPISSTPMSSGWRTHE